MSRSGQILPEVLETLSVIAQYDLTLATGHVTPAEAFMIMREAKTRGVQRMIVTHPTLGLGGTMTTEQLQEAAKLGAYIEFTADWSRARGPDRPRLSRRFGRWDPRCASSRATAACPATIIPMRWRWRPRALRGAGFTEKELNLMFKDNPAKLVKLPVLP